MLLRATSWSSAIRIAPFNGNLQGSVSSLNHSLCPDSGTLLQSTVPFIRQQPSRATVRSSKRTGQCSVFSLPVMDTTHRSLVEGREIQFLGQREFRGVEGAGRG